MKHKVRRRSSGEDEVQIIPEPRTVVGIVPQSLVVFLALYALLNFSSCASLPRIEDYAPSRADTAPKILGPTGPLSPMMSKAVMERLKGQAEPTDILQRYTPLMEVISGSPLVTGNKVTLLIDGPAAFAAMFTAIRNAKDHINIETFSFDDDEIGRRFADVLLQKQEEGVQVNLLYDSVGSFPAPSAFFQRLRDGGIQVREFNPINPFKLRGLVIHRDHRRILIVDGKVAFTGSSNISNIYTSGVSGSPSREQNGDRIQHAWRDTDVQIEGPAVAELQKLFLETWARAKGPESNRNYFPPLKQEGDDLMQVIGSTPGGMHRSTYMMYVSAFTYAENIIHLTTPYLVPDEQMMKALTHAAERGVDVKIILPANNDSNLVFYAGRSHYTALLESGVKLYERGTESILHAKTAVIDSLWSTVGTTNMDPWSFLHNDEVNVVILGHDFGLMTKC
ncbi:MAG TPA: phospholipase D-like domain-containing protein [Syntrophobacteria bacterium]|nr:phospholipase D-like domain-containing protein [Syntrophobacteria bacterium]